MSTERKRIGGIEMLTKRQLEDMVRCNIHSDCSKCACNDICIRDVMNHLAAKTALAYREILERHIIEEGHYSSLEELAEVETLLKESEVEEG